MRNSRIYQLKIQEHEALWSIVEAASTIVFVGAFVQSRVSIPRTNAIQRGFDENEKAFVCDL